MNNHSAFLIDDLHLGMKFNFSLLTIVAVLVLTIILFLR